MGHLRYILGFGFIALSVFNFLNLSLPILIVLFLLGYDIFPFLGKIGLIILVFFGPSYLPFVSSLAPVAIILVIMLVVDILSRFIPIPFIIDIVKLGLLFFAALIAVDILFAIGVIVVSFLIKRVI